MLLLKSIINKMCRSLHQVKLQLETQSTSGLGNSDPIQGGLQIKRVQSVPQFHVLSITFHYCMKCTAWHGAGPRFATKAVIRMQTSCHNAPQMPYACNYSH